MGICGSRFRDVVDDEDSVPIGHIVWNLDQLQLAFAFVKDEKGFNGYWANKNILTSNFEFDEQNFEITKIRGPNQHKNTDLTLGHLVKLSNYKDKDRVATVCLSLDQENFVFPLIEQIQTSGGKLCGEGHFL